VDSSCKTTSKVKCVGGANCPRVGTAPTLGHPPVKRFVDAYNPLSKTATEVKYGRKALTNFIERQVEKDVDLLANNPSVKKVVWKFFTSAATGEGGPTAPLLKLLLNSNIEVWVDGALQVAEVVP